MEPNNNLGTDNSGVENKNLDTNGDNASNANVTEAASGKSAKKNTAAKKVTKPEVTLESLHEMFSARFDEQEKTIAELQLKLAAKKGTEIGAATAKAIPSIPANLVNAQGKAYKWNLAHFVMPGTSIVFTAEEANQSPELIAAILALQGQEVLKEQV